MRLRKGFELHDICGENIIVAEGSLDLDFTKVTTLSDSAAYIWRCVYGREFNEADIVGFLLQEYDVTAVRAAKDVRGLMASLRDKGLLED